MHRFSCFGRKGLGAVVACGLAWLGLGLGQARAATLTLTVTESTSGATVSILDDTALDSNTALGAINVDVASLSAFGFTYFTSGTLTANSNSPGTAAVASLDQTGTVFRSTTGGLETLSIEATDIDYSSPSGPLGTMFSSASNTFTGTAAGNSQTFRSWFNPPVAVQGDRDTPSPLLTFTSTGPTPNSYSGDAAPTPVPLIPSYGLTNELVISLSASTATVESKNQYTGSTTVNAVPEPTTAVMMMTALPLTLLGWLRLRHRKP